MRDRKLLKIIVAQVLLSLLHAPFIPASLQIDLKVIMTFEKYASKYHIYTIKKWFHLFKKLFRSTYRVLSMRKVPLTIRDRLAPLTFAELSKTEPFYTEIKFKNTPKYSIF